MGKVESPIIPDPIPRILFGCPLWSTPWVQHVGLMQNPSGSSAIPNGSQHTGPTIVNWSDDPGGLSLEDCARRGIEAVAGLVISADIFETSMNPGELFCACVDIYHVPAGTGSDPGDYPRDYIGVNFREAEIRDGTYPVVGEEFLRMLLQRFSDGSVAARWGIIESSDNERSHFHVPSLAEDRNARSAVCRPLTLGMIPEQDEDDVNLPSFLILRDPGAGWQIWRRISPVTSEGAYVISDGFRKESYTMVFPLLNADVNWHFRVYDLPDGGVRVEMRSPGQG